jgi:hypothetical protein
VTAVVVNLALAWFVQAPKRNHPLMVLSGVATNAVGFDLSPGVSELICSDLISVTSAYSCVLCTTFASHWLL